MRKIIRLIQKYIKQFLDHLAKESLNRNKTILDKIEKGLFI